MPGYTSMSRDELIAELETFKQQYQRVQNYASATQPALRDNTQALLEAIVGHASFGMVVADSSGRFLFANAEACRITGTSQEAHLGFNLTGIEQRPWAMQYPDGRPMLLEDTPLAKAALQGLETRSEEFRVLRADGTECWVLCNGSPLYDQHGALQSGVVTFVEITHQKKRMAEAMQSQMAYQRIMGTVIDAYYKADKQGRLMLATSTVARILGYEHPEAILGKDLATTFYADPKQRDVFLQKLLANNSLTSYRLELKKADGTPVVVETTSRVITGLDGSYAGVEGLFRDVTARAQAEEQLLRSEFFYRTLFEHSGAATVLLNSTGLIRRVNSQALALSGYSREELEGKRHWQEVIDPGDLDWMAEYNERRNSEGPQPPNEYDFTLRDKQGNKKFVHARVDFLPETKERIVSMTDMTSRIAMEKELEKWNNSLKILVEERTEALARKNGELKAANQRLLELDEIKSNLLSSVSHELRTPLTSIMGFAIVTKNLFEKHFSSLALDIRNLASKAATIRNNLEIITREGGRLTRLINDLLDLAHVESGEFRWKDSKFPMGELLHMAVDAAYGEFQNKPGVELKIAIAQNMPSVFADKDKMQQVVLNLLNNAAKFTTEGEVVLAAEADARWVEVRVSDTGIGIPKHLQEHIFDKFYTVRSDDTLQANVVGTGLGLALCRQVVEHYRGTISVASAPGKGSTFTLKLPVAG